MALRIVKLTDGSEGEVGAREFHRLQAEGLVKESHLVSPAADQPEADAAVNQARQDLMNYHAEMRAGDRDTEIVPAKVRDLPVSKERGPSGTNRGVPLGGVGHQPGDGYGPNRIHREIATEILRGLILQAEHGFTPAAYQSLAATQERAPAKGPARTKASTRKES